jgi:hypothetical protein
VVTTDDRPIANVSAESGHPDEELVRELVARSLEEVETFLRREDVRSAFHELASDPRLWERSRKDLASFLNERGVSIPDGMTATARESEGVGYEAEGEASNAGIDLETLSSATKRVVGVVDLPTLVAVEATGTKRLVYSCQLVEVCRQESDPNVWGGKILWGCKTVCVGSGWKVV